MRWGIGIILLVITVAAAWSILPRKEHVLAPSRTTNMQTIYVTSSAFEHNGGIPEKYTCDADNVSPPLEISGVPANAKSLALIMHDPDAPRAGGWTHWVKFNLSPELRVVPEGTEPERLSLGETRTGKGVSGKGTGGESTYQGPCPPSGTHRYIFSVYAVDTELSLNAGATKSELEKAMEGRILAQGGLIGSYSRKK